MTKDWIRGALLVATLSGASCAGAPPAPSPAATPSASPSAAPSAAPAAAPPSCAKDMLAEIAGRSVWKLSGAQAVGFRSKMTIDADGAPNAYHKDDGKALDNLANAGKNGNWWALVTHNGKRDGKPIVQGARDPAPGYYVSTTALFDKAKPTKDPRRYVDSTKIPYVAVPPAATKEWGVSLGDFAVVVNSRNGKIAYAIVADVGPADVVGEGSIALADALGIPSSPKDGGTDSGVVYVIFTGSGSQAPRSIADIDREGQRLFEALGGRPKLAACFP